MIDKILQKIKKLNNKQKILVIIVGFIIILLAFVALYKFFYIDDSELLIENDVEENIIKENDNNEIKEEEQISSKIGIQNNKKTVTVHVVGEVNSPGVVTLDEGSRIIDAINAAGGKTEDADLSRINLAYVIEDGVQIYIPSITEVSKESKTNENQIQYITDGPGEGIILVSEAQDVGDEKIVKVNINTANVEKLQTLPGIGESTAKKIIEYRDKNGKFKNIEELKNVSGIGESKFNSLKDKITI